jgi:cell division protein FtsN
MAKDYAKNKKKKKRSGASRGNKKSSVSTPLLVLTSVLVGGLASLLVYLKWFQPKANMVNHANLQQDSNKQGSQKPIKQNKTLPREKETIQDDEVPFYKTHEEMVNKTVDIPSDELVLPEDKHQYSYLMPCGSFREKNRAEELKAQIAMAGYESNIKPIEAASGAWFRVNLGPYKSKRKAESIRHRLQDNGFNNCKIWKRKIK